MTFCHLSSLRGAGGCDMGQGTFATNGSDPARVKAVLKSQKASSCKCKRQWRVCLHKSIFLSRFHDLDVLLFLHVKCQHVATWCFRCLQFCHPRCWKNITYKALLRVCILFWSLAKPAQDTLLWAMQTGGGYHDDGDSDCSESSDGESRTAGGQVSWCIDGVQICRRAFQRMLGLGCGRLNRTRGRFQGMDERHLKVQDRGARAAESSASVNAFMYKMYYSVGESMPTGWLDSFLCCSILFVRFASEFCCHFCSDSVSYYKILFAHG